jgi:hypothetical protein
MPSHVISSYAYDANARSLSVTFVSGRCYRYDGVPPDEAEAMHAAFAKGVFFNRRIRDRYPATPLEFPEGSDSSGAATTHPEDQP